MTIERLAYEWEMLQFACAMEVSLSEHFNKEYPHIRDHIQAAETWEDLQARYNVAKDKCDNKEPGWFYGALIHFYARECPRLKPKHY